MNAFSIPLMSDAGGDDGQLAVAVELADRRRRLQPARPEAERDADALAVGQRSPRRATADARAPRSRHSRAPKDLISAPSSAGVAGDEHVLQAQLDRVEAQLGRRAGRSASRPRTPPAARPARGRRPRDTRLVATPTAVRSCAASGTGRPRASSRSSRRPSPPARRGRRRSGRGSRSASPSRVDAQLEVDQLRRAPGWRRRSPPSAEDEPDRPPQLAAPRPPPAARRSSACRRTRRRSARPDTRTRSIEQPEQLREALRAP